MLLRLILFTHRYVAVAVGLLVALWCLSGFVMMYQGYPQLTAAQRLQALQPLDLSGCCSTSFLPDDDLPLGSFRIEMLQGEPVLHQGGVAPIRLASGTPLEAPTVVQMQAIAADHAARAGIAGAAPEWAGEVDIDQWTVQTARRHQPVHHFRLRDPAGTELYINGATGEVFQRTTRRERVLSWFGAIPHWLYFTPLRRDGALWSEVVIWSAVLGTFLTLTGLYVGIARWRRRRRPGTSISPFRGWWYWHHMLGLVFGIVTLTWMFSGLLTMSPWGWLERSDTDSRVRAHLAGSAIVAAQRQFLEHLPRELASGEFVQLEGRVFDDALQVIATRSDGSTQRLDATARPAPLDAHRLRERLAAFGNGLEQFDTLRDEDTYYYGHKRSVELPVYRAVLDDSGRTRVYVSPTTAAVRVVDAEGRLSRWTRQGMHGLDFSGLRVRPVWDIVTLLLLAGVTAVAITGSWMALKRIRRDLAHRR